jgi:hypothetical protein
MPVPPVPVPPPAGVPFEAAASGETADANLKQWQSIHAISLGICQNLERVNAMVKELPANYADAIGELLKPPAPKPSPLTKLAAGVSIAAAILSVLSLSLSQSARQAVLNRDSAPAIAITPRAMEPHEVVYHAPAPASAPIQVQTPPAPPVPRAAPRASAPIAMAPGARRVPRAQKSVPSATARRRAKAVARASHE